MRTLFAFHALVLVFPVTVSGEDFKTKSFLIEADHWLWMARIAAKDPDYTPEESPTSNFQMYEFRNANQAYEACGLEIIEGGAFFYAVAGPQLIARLTPTGWRKIALIHKTMAAWKEGRYDEWYHSNEKPERE